MVTSYWEISVHEVAVETTVSGFLDFNIEFQKLNNLNNSAIQI